MRFTAITYSIVAIALLLSSCGSQKVITGTTDKKNPSPEWVNSRPLSSANYIGIGVASKVREPLDYASVAKKNALNDLASEISVEVKGESFLNTLEVNRQFHEEFVSNISTTTREKIEGYDIAGTYETKDEYWVYYRLSKAKHDLIKREKKNKALNAANDYFVKGKDAQIVGNVPVALEMHLRALNEMQEYWADVNEYVVDGATVYLDNEIYNNLRTIVNDIRIEPAFPQVVLNHGNGFANDMKVLVHSKGNPVRNVAVSFKYDKGRFARPKFLLSDDAGQLRVNVSSVNLANKDNVVELEVDVEEMIDESLKTRLLRPLIQSLKGDKRQVPISVELPKAYITSDERNFGSPTATQLIRSELQNLLSLEGIEFVSNVGDADYLIDITSNTSKGGTSQGFHVAFLEMTMNVKDRHSGNEIFRKGMHNVKGLQLNFNAAGIEAYKKGVKKLEKEFLSEMIESLL